MANPERTYDGVWLGSIRAVVDPSYHEQKDKLMACWLGVPYRSCTTVPTDRIFQPPSGDNYDFRPIADGGSLTEEEREVLKDKLNGLTHHWMVLGRQAYIATLDPEDQPPEDTWNPYVDAPANTQRKSDLAQDQIDALAAEVPPVRLFNVVPAPP